MRRLKQGMTWTPTFCSSCGDTIEEGRDPWGEHAELDALSERLRLKRCEVKRKINHLQSPIVRQLPPDVTSTIFEFCLPFTDHHLLPCAGEDISIPLSLGAICSYWRDIAWSSPRLWSSLVVRVTRKHDSHITGIAQEWLARSGQLPLTIRIYSESYNTTLIELADIINQYSTRWFELDLYLPLRYYHLFHPTDNHAPILESIRFFASACATNLNFQLTCPRLDRASLSYFPAQRINIQWDNLTHLALHSTSINDSFLILRKTSRLIFCEVSGSSGFIEPSIGPLVLTSLRSLQLMTDFNAGFLNNLTVPYLEELSLPNYYNPSMEVITSFLRRSTCSLRSFTVMFSISPTYFEGFINILQSMPSLITLSIISITDTTDNLDDIIPEDYDPQNILQLVAKILSSQSASPQHGFLPNLKILEYTGKLNLRPGNYDDLHPMLPADNVVHTPLHLLKISLNQHRIPKNMISYLLSLVQRGVTVNVLFHSEDILQSSIDYYRLKDDFFCWDSVDNFDSSLFS